MPLKIQQNVRIQILGDLYPSSLVFFGYSTVSLIYCQLHYLARIASTTTRCGLLLICLDVAFYGPLGFCLGPPG